MLAGEAVSGMAKSSTLGYAGVLAGSSWVGSGCSKRATGASAFGATFATRAMAAKALALVLALVASSWLYLISLIVSLGIFILLMLIIMHISSKKSIVLVYRANE